MDYSINVKLKFDEEDARRQIEKIMRYFTERRETTTRVVEQVERRERRGIGIIGRLRERYERIFDVWSRRLGLVEAGAMRAGGAGAGAGGVGGAGLRIGGGLGLLLAVFAIIEILKSIFDAIMKLVSRAERFSGYLTASLRLLDIAVSIILKPLADIVGMALIRILIPFIRFITPIIVDISRRIELVFAVLDVIGERIKGAIDAIVNNPIFNAILMILRIMFRIFVEPFSKLYDGIKQFLALFGIKIEEIKERRTGEFKFIEVPTFDVGIRNIEKVKQGIESTFTGIDETVRGIVRRFLELAGFTSDEINRIMPLIEDELTRLMTTQSLTIEQIIDATRRFLEENMNKFGFEEERIRQIDLSGAMERLFNEMNEKYRKQADEVADHTVNVVKLFVDNVFVARDELRGWVVNKTMAFIEGLFNEIRNAVNNMMKVERGDVKGQSVWMTIWSTVFDVVSKGVSGLFEWIGNMLGKKSESIPVNVDQTVDVFSGMADKFNVVVNQSISKIDDSLSKYNSVIEREVGVREEGANKIDNVINMSSARMWSTFESGIVRMSGAINSFVLVMNERFVYVGNKLKVVFDDFINSLSRSTWSVISAIYSLANAIMARAREGYQTGGYVERTGLYLLHAGEYVIPSWKVSGGNEGMNVNVNVRVDVNSNNIDRVIDEVVNRVRIELFRALRTRGGA